MNYSYDFTHNRKRNTRVARHLRFDCISHLLFILYPSSVITLSPNKLKTGSIAPSIHPLDIAGYCKGGGGGGVRMIGY